MSRKFVTIDCIDEKQASSLSQTYIATPVTPVGKSVPNVCVCTCGCSCECGVVVVVRVGLGMGVCKKAGNFNPLCDLALSTKNGSRSDC